MTTTTSEPTAAELEARVLAGDRSVTAGDLAAARDREHFAALQAQADQRRAAEQAEADRQAAIEAVESATGELLAPETLAEGRRLYAELVEQITTLKAVTEVYVQRVNGVLRDRSRLGLSDDSRRLGIHVLALEGLLDSALRDVVGAPWGHTPMKHVWRSQEALDALDQASREAAERRAQEVREQAEARARPVRNPLPTGGLVTGESVPLRASATHVRTWRGYPGRTS